MTPPGSTTLTVAEPPAIPAAVTPGTMADLLDQRLLAVEDQADRQAAIKLAGKGIKGLRDHRAQTEARQRIEHMAAALLGLR